MNTTTGTIPSSPTSEELEFIRAAALFLENPGLAMRLANTLGKPIEALQNRLPERANQAISKATRSSLEAALRVAVRSLTTSSSPPGFPEFAHADAESVKSGRMHLAATALTGAIGGAFGLFALPVELPVTTTLMLRSIASTATHHGADLSRAEDRLECLYVFMLGTPSPADDAAESAYYASRLGFTEVLRSAASYLAAHTAADALRGLEKGTVPALARLIARVATRFEINVSQKAMAEAVPVIGAVGGAAINAAFTHHFSEAARYHFGLKRLEKIYGREAIQTLYGAPKT